MVGRQPPRGRVVGRQPPLIGWGGRMGQYLLENFRGAPPRTPLGLCPRPRRRLISMEISGILFCSEGSYFQRNF